MKLLDTGVLLEFFSGSEEEVDKIDALFREMEKQKEKLLVTEEVVLELVYYLEQVYGWEREVVADVVNTVLLDSLFSVENRDVVQRAVKLYSSSKLSFLDSLKSAKAKKRKVKEVLSFNRRFEKAGFKLISP
ncbi:putative nucleic-acid-binding protein [Hydrogenivirga caldilitoris]|uniref:Putative nucleic-acid-binding protein n=1 Tax=Hydrogenivirga caldilitoris TaxID=246264 RepID=A0A497XRA5_9AQUI|nr:PIN domain-containing protein [Hydrogenivirga caldilitoris]RLJ71525.1 putative nucleic-acid-binding protein [Hydrogenivirga caldilitoris]